MFNKFKNFGVFVLVQFCINTVNAMDEYVIGSNKNESNWYINNTNTIQNNIRDFISTCNTADEITVGQKSMLRNIIIKSIDNYNANNVYNISLVGLEEAENNIMEEHYNNFINYINICAKENIINKEEYFNFLNILLENNITCLVNHFFYETCICTLGLLYENLQQLSEQSIIFKPKITKEFINWYWTYNSKIFRIMRKISSNLFNILEHSSTSSDNMWQYYFKFLKNNYTTNKNNCWHNIRKRQVKMLYK